MRLNSDTQKVDIDTYFSDLDDHTRSDHPSRRSRVPETPTVLALKQLLIAPPSASAPVLQPYTHDQSLRIGNRSFSADELEAAHGAVCNLRDQIHSPTSPTEVEPPSQPLPTPAPPRRRLFLCGLRIAAALTATAITFNMARPYSSTCLASQCYAPLVDQIGTWRIKAQTAAQTAAQSVLSFHAPSSDQASLDPRHLDEGMRYGYEAARMTQRASTPQDWQQVIHLWQLALHSLDQVDTDSRLYRPAQTKAEEYRRNLAYSRVERTQSAFRLGVKVAEEASYLASKATTAADWQRVAQRWQMALRLMQAVPRTSDHFPIAQTKLVEYSTKFAYTQRRYLDSQEP